MLDQYRQTSMNKSWIKILLFCCLLTPATLMAGYSYMHFDSSRITLNQELFRRYVKPQLKTLTQEYIMLLKRFGPLEGSFIELRQQVDAFAHDWNHWRPDCISDIERCKVALQSFHERARGLEREMMLLRNSKLSLRENADNIDNVLLLGHNVDSMIVYTYRLLHRLEEMIISLKLGRSGIHNIYVNSTPFVDKMRIYSELVLFGALPHAFAVEFDTLWTHFIGPIESKIVQDESLDYLLQGLGDLNLTWNAFHMRMTKSSLPQNRENNQLLGVMHNRWTSVVRLLLTSYRDGMKSDEKELLIEQSEGQVP